MRFMKQSKETLNREKACADILARCASLGTIRKKKDCYYFTPEMKERIPIFIADAVKTHGVKEETIKQLLRL